MMQTESSVVNTSALPVPSIISRNAFWNDFHADTLRHVASFCDLIGLKHMSLCCQNWRKILSIDMDDDSSWNLWFQAMNHEASKIKSLDRTGKSTHFLVTRSLYDSFDSMYHFAKFATFSPVLLEYTLCDSSKIANTFDTQTTQSVDSLLSQMSVLNAHSKSVVGLFIKGLDHEIKSESKPQLTVKRKQKAEDQGTNEMKEIDEIQEMTSHHGEEKMSLIRRGMPSILRCYEYLLNAVDRSDYNGMYRLFQNIILMESRPILRWFLFYIDRSGCFEAKEMKMNDDEQLSHSKTETVDFGDVTVFLHNLETYISNIVKLLCEQEECAVSKANILFSHRSYLMEMYVDIDEVRSRGVSSVKYWSRQGTMACNPDQEYDDDL